MYWYRLVDNELDVLQLDILVPPDGKRDRCFTAGYMYWFRLVDNELNGLKLDIYLECPDAYGWFPYTADCHKYILCIMGYPQLRTCPEHFVYSDTNGACIPGDKCPKSASDPVPVECLVKDGLFPHPLDCRKYIKCVNEYPYIKYCKPDQAFNPEKKTCTTESLAHCRDNQIHSVL
ncbi:hypothetical protein CEXT_564921 [Caerostris extrusa]|uniref:Chitin-binding type-2 domain-containing protein n=1 Tax=Caerostris extrusa TaxID=172846 RepID=A0AAV4Q5X9_CAEEX|nr:hypothetical protein CEXT_564921 [Caerostris extrusa]